MSFDSKIIQTWFHTAIWTSANTNFKFMRKFHIFPANIIIFIDFFRQRLRIIISVNTRCSFTCSNRTNFCTCSTKIKLMLCCRFSRILNLFIRNSHNFCRQTTCENNLTVTEFFCNFRNHSQIFCRKNTACRNKSA